MKTVQLLTGDKIMRLLVIMYMFLAQNIYASVQDNMIRFSCYQQKSDPSSPWLKTRIKIRTNNAIKLKKKNLFLTTATSVADASYCEWKILDTNDIVPLEVGHVDPILGLAILKSKAASAVKKIPVDIGDDVGINTKLDIYSLRGSNKPVRTSLRVKAVKLVATNQSYYEFRHLVFDSRSKNLGFSEPIFHKR